MEKSSFIFPRHPRQVLFYYSAEGTWLTPPVRIAFAGVFGNPYTAKKLRADNGKDEAPAPPALISQTSEGCDNVHADNLIKEWKMKIQESRSKERISGKIGTIMIGLLVVEYILA